MPAALAILVALLAAPPPQGVEVVEKIGDQAPLDLPFVDETGKKVSLGDYFGGDKPVLLTLVYYECPLLCNLMLNGVVEAMAPLKWAPGRDFRVVTLSINPRETPALAASKMQSYLTSLDREGAGDGWAFLTGERPNIKRLADALGWGYRYDPDTMEYLHGAAVMLLTPEGKVTRYLYGAELGSSQLELALFEAGDGKLGGLSDSLLAGLYRFDPVAKKYVVHLAGAVALSAVLVLPFALLFALAALRRWRKARATLEPNGADLMVRGVIPNG